VPDVVGLTVQQAKVNLVQDGFRVAYGIEGRGPALKAATRPSVIRQSPAPGTSERAGSLVTITQYP
jgi:beta-lactam-binding protein with PASTA domain